MKRFIIKRDGKVQLIVLKSSEKKQFDINVGSRECLQTKWSGFLGLIR